MQVLENSQVAGNLTDAIVNIFGALWYFVIKQEKNRDDLLYLKLISAQGAGLDVVRLICAHVCFGPTTSMSDMCIPTLLFHLGPSLCCLGAFV
jgi:hypothetical protein